MGVLPNQKYYSTLSYGFTGHPEIVGYNRNLKNDLTNDFITISEPFYFYVNVPEGNYRVSLILGDFENASQTSVKAESRRVMLHNVETGMGMIARKTFLVNVRTPKINDALSIRLNKREYPYLN